MKMKKCAVCGHEQKSGDICEQCGGVHMDEIIKEELQEKPVENPETDQENKKKMKKKKWGKFGSIAVIIILLIALLGSNGANSSVTDDYDKLSESYAVLETQNEKLQADYDSLKKNYQTVESENESLKAQNESLESEKNELVNGAAKQLVDVKNAYEDDEWQEVVDLAAAIHEKYNGTEEDKDAQKLAKKAQEKLDEAAEAAAAEEEKGYETGITYDQLARTPDDYMGKKVKFYGKVIQVIEDDDATQIRLAVDDDYDRVVYGEFSKSITSSRVLEDDEITIYGTSVGTISYSSTLGGKITIPGIYIEKIDQ